MFTSILVFPIISFRFIFTCHFDFTFHFHSNFPVIFFHFSLLDGSPSGGGDNLDTASFGSESTVFFDVIKDASQDDFTESDIYLQFANAEALKQSGVHATKPRGNSDWPEEKTGSEVVTHIRAGAGSKAFIFTSSERGVNSAEPPEGDRTSTASRVQQFRSALKNGKVESLRNYFHTGNMLLTLSGVALMACGSYVRANVTSSFVIVESGDLYSWYLWMSTLIIFAGVFLFLLALGGYKTSYNASSVNLFFYSWASGASGLAMLSLGIGCFALKREVQRLIETRFASSPEEGDDVGDAVNDGNLYFSILGSCLIVASIMSLLPCAVSVRLRQTLNKVVAEVVRPDTWRTTEERRTRSMLKVCCIVNVMLGFVAGAYSFNSLSYASVSGLNSTFPSFLLLSLALGQCIVGLVGVEITKKIDTGPGWAPLLFSFILLNVALAVFLCMGAVVTFTSYPQIENDVRQQWSEITAITTKFSQSQFIALQKDNVIVTGIMELTLLFVLCTTAIVAGTIYKWLSFQRQLEHISNRDLLTNFVWQSLEPWQKFVFIWATLRGCMHIFISGCFVAYSSWLRDNDVPWFLVIWNLYGQADERYLNNDPTVRALEGISAGVVGPLCFVSAWGILTYQPYREAAVMMASFASLLVKGMYFATLGASGCRECLSNKTLFIVFVICMNVAHTLIAAIIFAKCLIRIGKAQTLQDQWNSASSNIMKDLMEERSRGGAGIATTPPPNNEGSPIPMAAIREGGTEGMCMESIRI
jgi:hypothetical protein